MTPEGKVKKAVKAVLKKHGIWYYMPVQNGMGVVGIPDFVGCHNGRFIGIETKAPGKLNNLSANQKLRIKEIQSAGGLVFVVDSAEMLEEMLRDAGVI